MLFRRRTKATARERFRIWLWPRVSWRRSGLYHAKRVLRLSGTPYAIAMGAGVGAAVSFTPFIGFHFVITFALAWLVGANLIAGAIGTCIGNPATFPFMWAATYELGQLILLGASGSAPERIGHELAQKPLDQVWPLVAPMLVGSIPLGAATGCIVYFIVYKAVSVYRAARRERFAGRRQAGSTAE